MRAVKVLGRILSGALTAVLTFALVCNLYTIGVRHFTGNPQPDVFGWSWAVVISGSMEPQIMVNDLVVVHEEETYATGDIITYRSGASVVTHRIVGMENGNYITRGDANNTNDMYPVEPEGVIGRVSCVVPRVGLFIEYLRTPLGMTCMVLIGLLLIEIPYLLEKGRREKGGRS